MNRKRRIEQELYKREDGNTHIPDVYGVRRRKQAKIRSDLTDSHGEGYELLNEDITVESDAVTAATYLIAHNTQSTIPVCFLHQLYSILSNHTTVDREIQQAIKDGQWRKFHVIGKLEDEHLLMKVDDYCKMMDEAKTEYEQKQEKTDAFDKFKQIILDKHHLEVSISRHTLLEDVKLTEKEISILVSYGLLLPHIQLDLYWFSIRRQGHFMSNILGGRTELLRMLNKRHTKDILEKLLKTKRLHKTTLDTDFLLHDMIGSGRVERCTTTMGNLIRLTRKGEEDR
ncbi:serine-threonine protein kinase 19-domain-containing protein [Pilobolus umbonatus]|nr:serine-threonine protein kinase 19-domain-containing protein [Pilobolus umbonatus]